MVLGADGIPLVKQPKTQAGKRFLNKRAPLLEENDKATLFYRGNKTNEDVSNLLKDLYQLKKPNARMLKRRNPYYPFDDETPFERTGSKFDASLFAFVSHSKKRPSNLVMGRLHQLHILDMFEFGVESYRSLADFKNVTAALGSKPCLVFVGDRFDSDAEYTRLKNFFIDFFRGPKVDQLCLRGIELLIAVCQLPNGSVSLRGYKIQLKKSGQRTPYVELEETGPSCRLQLRRRRLASTETFSAALKQPKSLKMKKTKNISKDLFGNKYGRLHIRQQPLEQLKTRKLKGLKRRAGEQNGEQQLDKQPIVDLPNGTPVKRQKRTRVQPDESAE